ncbi:hypothetical protein GLYMA_18G169651v4 [Glycine max]|nr:hypothetical protein GLYMA_18G169651v4 [Glycine max]KAH1154823.1 hypothetical protein GYH30_050216 [Glycine max]
MQVTARNHWAGDVKLFMVRFICLILSEGASGTDALYSYNVGELALMKCLYFCSSR